METNLFEIAGESRERLVNIERKIDFIIDGISGPKAGGAIFKTNTDNPDQWYGPTTWAQHGDDLAVVNIFKLLGIEIPSYIDLGAHHPFRISNTALLYQRGSRGVNVEANPNLIEEFYKFRPDDINLNVGVGAASGELKFYMIDKWSGRNTFNKDLADKFVSENPQFSVTEVINVPVFSLTDIINLHLGGVFPNFLTLDVEGFDESILKSYDFKNNSRPDVICVETDLIGDDGYGDRICSYLLGANYFVYVRCGSNSIFVSEIYRNRLY